MKVKKGQVCKLKAGLWYYFKKPYNFVNGVLLPKDTEIEILDVNDRMITVRVLTGEYTGQTKYIQNYGYITKEYELLRTIPKFKQYDLVKLFRSDLGNPLDKTFMFMSYLDTAVKEGDVVLDCVLVDDKGEPTLGKSANLKKVQPVRTLVNEKDLDDMEKNIENVVLTCHVDGNKTTVIAKDPNNGNYYKGVARCNPKDLNNPMVGFQIALARALGEEGFANSLIEAVSKVDKE